MQIFYHIYFTYFLKGNDAYLTSPKGSFTSHNYPNNYDNNMNCSWLITVDKSSAITLSFFTFQLNWGDSLRIYDGSSTSSHLIMDVSGQSLPPPFNSSTNQVLLVFNSDYYYTASGFNAFYYEVIHGSVDFSYGTLTLYSSYFFVFR